MLRQRAADAHAVIPEFEQIREASMAKVEAANALRRLVSHAQDGGFGLKDDDRRVIAANKHLDKMTADFKRLTELQEVRTAAWQTASQALAAARTGCATACPAAASSKRSRSSRRSCSRARTVIDAIETHRRRGRELRADLHRIESAPFPSSYAKQRMREQIETRAMQAAPSVARLVELDGPVDFATTRITSEVHAERRSLAFSEAADVIGLVAWLHRDALIAALDREIASEADDKAALSHEARQQREAETMADLLSVEREEAALIWTAQAQGLPCEFRHDTDPLAILQLRLVTVARPTNPSSPERARLRPRRRAAMTPIVRAGRVACHSGMHGRGRLVCQAAVSRHTITTRDGRLDPVVALARRPAHGLSRPGGASAPVLRPTKTRRAIPAKVASVASGSRCR